LHVDPENTSSPGFFVTGNDSPVNADYKEPKVKYVKLNKGRNNVFADGHTWSIFKGSPSNSLASAGTISPSLILMISPGTSIDASCSLHWPSRRTWEFQNNGISLGEKKSPW
jgi:hypothetical protein